jgi:alpha-beta hydrolase superfamily lysophospholipase
MSQQSGTRLTPSGSTTAWRRWLPGQPPLATFAIVHGFGEYTDLYQQVAEYFVARRYAVVAIDLRGHGRSPGARGFIRSWADYRDDVESLVALAGETAPDTPVYLVGNSMGGLIAIDYALHFPSRLQGVIAMSPAVGKIGVAPVLLWISRVLSRVWPTFSLDSGIDSAAMTRDAGVAARLEADPLVHGRGSARLGTEIQETIAAARARAGDLAVPILIQHGEADTITDPADSRWFFDRITMTDKEIRTYPESYHNLCVDLNWEDVLRDIVAWTSRRSSPSSA